MNEYNILDLLRLFEGEIQPVADGHIDSKHRDNIEAWNQVLYEIVDEFMKCANTNLRIYGSAKEISDYAREALKTIYSDLGEAIERWEGER